MSCSKLVLTLIDQTVYEPTKAPKHNNEETNVSWQRTSFK